MRKKIIITTILLSLISCGKAQKKNFNKTDSIELLTQEMLDKKSYDKALNDPIIKDKNCNAIKGFHNCDYEITNIEYAKLNPSSKNKRILVLDTALFPISFFSKNNDKVLGVYQANESGKFQLFQSRINAPVILEEFIEKTKNRPLDFYINNSYEIERFNFSVQRLTQTVTDFPVNHAETIFEFLAEKNPDSQMILARYPWPETDILCDMENDFKKLRSFINNAANTLGKLVRDNEINFINNAVGKSYFSASRQLEYICGEKDIVVNEDDKREFHKILFSFHEKLYEQIPETLIIQAIDNAENPGFRVNESNYPTACKKFPNVIHSGFVSTLDVFPEEGSINSVNNLVPSTRSIAQRCGEVFVNGRTDETIMEAWFNRSIYGIHEATSKEKEVREAILADQHTWWDQYTYKFYVDGGLQVKNKFYMSTSWSTSVTTSFLIYLLNEKKVPFYSLKKKVSGKTFDPLYHQQFLRRY